MVDWYGLSVYKNLQSMYAKEILRRYEDDGIQIFHRSTKPPLPKAETMDVVCVYT